MSDELDVQSRREEMRRKSREEAESIVSLAGFEIRHTWELANGYWPASPRYDDVRKPWWLFLTQVGPVRVGWRKRVLEIEWDATDLRGIVTDDNVTKGDTYVHAWSRSKAVEYLTKLRLMCASPA